MRRKPRLFRLSASVALLALLAQPLLPAPRAFAQSPQQQGQISPDQARGDPPNRVGRIAGLVGQVSYRTGGDTDWTAASRNYPVSSGYGFWTSPTATAEIEVSASRIVLAGTTEFDVTTLDTTGLQAVAAQGESYIHLRDVAPDEVWSVQTPRGLVRLTGAGRYGIVAGTTEQPTLVTVLDGNADIQAPNLSLQVTANQTATIAGTDNFLGSIGPAQRDGFLDARLAAERPPQRAVAAVPQQVARMPGGEELIGAGSWGTAPEYGQVWYPPVSRGWVPYRHGHWAYVAPWGWTWIDDASWGFAPFHYGRWLQLGGRWAWTPGEVAVAAPPVYAPALVAFIGVGAGFALGAALASGSIGWVPLGPREVYHPWYHASDAYVRHVNINHVTNVTTINSTNVTVNNFVNRSAATSVPAAAMTGSRPIRAVAQPITATQFASARPVIGQQPLVPAAGTAGVTPAVARQMNLAAAGAPNHRPAPGPAVSANASEPGFRPALAGPAATAAAVQTAREPGVHPAAAAGVAAGVAAHPGTASPAAAEVRPSGRPAAQTAHPARAEPLAAAGPQSRRPAANHVPPHAPPAAVNRPVAETPHAVARAAFAPPAAHAAPLQASHAAAAPPRAEPAQHHEKRPGDR